MIKRTHTLKLIILSMLFASSVFAQNAQWYKGNLHMHTFWSDGGVFPEEAAEFYSTNGYHFISITDHHIVQTNEKNWQEIGGKKVSKAVAERYLKRYGKTADTKTEKDKETGEDKNFVRLKTIGEVKKAFDKKGAFLIIPGLELTGRVNEPDSREVHMNAINVQTTLPYKKESTVKGTIEANMKSVAAYGKEHSCETLLMFNHPLWRYFDVQVETMMELPDLRFIELGNAEFLYDAPQDWYSAEQYWDIANAFRVSAGHRPLYYVATDDTHAYPKDALRRWVCVRSTELAPDALMRAMHNGDFYATCGVNLRDVRFNEKTGTLSVEVHPKRGETYEINFIVTRADFDRTVKTFDDPAKDKKPARTGTTYSDTIGVVAKKVSGISGFYTLRPDDMYVRATVTSSTKKVKPLNGGPAFDTAYTQPVGWQQWQSRK